MTREELVSLVLNLADRVEVLEQSVRSFDFPDGEELGRRLNGLLPTKKPAHLDDDLTVSSDELGSVLPFQRPQ